MKKITSSFIIVAALVFSLFFTNTPASAKVYWDGVELKKGQIGRLLVVKDTQLYKLSGSQKTPARTLKAGEKYRIYTFLPGKLGLGGGYYVDRNNSVKYETPSKVKLQALGVKIVEKEYKGTIKYPQVVSLVSSTAKDKINATIEKHIRDSYNSLMALEESEYEDQQNYEDEYGYPVPEDEKWMYTYEYEVSYSVKYNENNQLSVLIYDYMYTGGVHGMSHVTSYNFDCLTGNEIKLTDVAKTRSALTKIKNYAKVDLLNQHGRGQVYIFEEDLDRITIDNDRPFYFTSNGIKVKFGEYEVASYSEGMPEANIPYSVFR